MKKLGTIPKSIKLKKTTPINDFQHEVARLAQSQPTPSPAHILQTTAGYERAIRLYTGSTMMIMNTRVMENVSFKVTNWPNNFNCKKIAPLTLPRKSVSTTTLQALCRIPKIPNCVYFK